MMHLFQELQSYVGFGADDERILPTLHPRLAPSFEAVVEKFYERVLEHDDARDALTRGERQVGHLKVTLRRWLDELFLGPWDEAYVQRRARIGRVHVQIALPQHYMVSAMHLVRTELRDRLSQQLDPQSPEGHSALDAMQKILDIDLALMLHTYREDLEARNARAERLATFGQLVGSIGHELRNPLGVIETSVYVLKSRPGEDPRAQKHLDRIGAQVVLANEIITQLLDLIRERPLSLQQVRLGRLLADVAQTVSTPTGVTLHLQGEHEDWTVDGDPTQLRQVISNLVDNAIHAASPVGSVRAILTHPDEGHLVLTVDDTGPGIDVSVRNRLFEPLVTTKPKGIGLGLALVRRIVDRHSGSIEVSRGPLGGARFKVELPVVNQGEP
jgi:signal transduction histidine kinase